MKEKSAYTIDMIKEKSRTIFCNVKTGVSSKLSFLKEKTDTLTRKQKTILGGGAAGVLVVAVVATIMLNSAPASEAVEPVTVANEPAGPVWEVVINGQNVVDVASEEDAWAVFDGITAYYQSENSEIVNIAYMEEIVLREKEQEVDAEGNAVEPAEPYNIMTVADAVDYIMTGTKEKITYIVQGGDTMWDIAVANGISPTELQDMNPTLNPSRLSIGQELNLVSIKPFVNVLITEKVTATERVAYSTQYESTADLYKGQTQVKSPGSYGSQEVVSEITKQNGYVVSSNVISKTTITEPVTQIALKGTQTVPTYTGSGTLSSPVASIEISSGYGASRGSRRHLGIDLRNPSGTPFMAADAGAVTYVGYKGSYGNLIIIDHGNGVVTKYAHAADMYVSIGDTVEKGETIGTVGRTGNATGYVLHFEVLINGVNQNPTNYI